VIAHGGYPMVVDLETLLMAQPRSGALPEQPAGISHLGQGRSVLQSLLLPLLHRVPTGVFADVSPFSGDRNRLAEHAAAIEWGFVYAYRFIERQREALLSECGPLRAFERCSIRIVLRDTALYFQLLRHSIDPAVWSAGSRSSGSTM
jgi:lantibiotic modifying enzyme